MSMSHLFYFEVKIESNTSLQQIHDKLQSKPFKVSKISHSDTVLNP